MANPFTLGLTALSTGLTAFGALTQAQGSQQLGAAQAAQANYQAAVAQVNSQIAKQNAAYAVAQGEQQAQQQGMATRQEIGQTKAQQGAGNLDVNRGSNVAVRASEAEIGAENQAVVRNNAARAAYGYQVQSVQATAQAGLYGMEAQTAQIAGRIGATSSILGGASSVASKWLQASQQFGGFGGSSTSSDWQTADGVPA